MTPLTLSKAVMRRYILGRQGLWPGRRAASKPGVAQIIRQVGAVQVDPINVVARSHDIVLWGRVAGYRPQARPTDEHVGDQRLLAGRSNAGG